MAERSARFGTDGGRARAQSAPAPDDSDTDQTPALVQAAQDGDRDALERLLTSHAGPIYSICLRMLGNPEEARDLSQDAMVRLIEALHSYDGRAKFTTWMTRVVMNLCITHLRRQRLRRHASLNVSSGREGENSGTLEGWARTEQQTEPEPALRVEHDDMLHRLGLAMDRLEPDARAILVLRDVRDLDYAQIGQVLGVPVGTVKSRMFRARAALRDLMESMADAPRSVRGAGGKA